MSDAFLEKPAPGSLTIRARLLIFFVLMALLPAGLISLVSAQGSLAAGEQRSINQLESVATLKEAEIHTWLQNLLLDLKVEQSRALSRERFQQLLQSPVESEAFEDAYAAQQAQLRESVEVGEKFEELFLIDAEGRVLLSTTSSQEGQLLSNRPYFKEGLKGEYVSAPFYSLEFNQPSIVVVSPVLDDQGQVVGVFGGRAGLATLSEIMLERAGLGETGETYLVADNFASATALRFVDADIHVSTEGSNAAVGQQRNGSGRYVAIAGFQSSVSTAGCRNFMSR
ncbi:MAG: cache domain-containing protein [Ardenticatenales bacterium]|nr:cache domain-containing protein [Ardenticatenales bacterium]